jgi:hypothetical protein
MILPATVRFIIMCPRMSTNGRAGTDAIEYTRRLGSNNTRFFSGALSAIGSLKFDAPSCIVYVVVRRCVGDTGSGKPFEIQKVRWFLGVFEGVGEGGILSPSPGSSKNGIKINVFRTT